MSSGCKQIVVRLIDEAWNHGQSEELDEILGDILQSSDLSSAQGRDAVKEMIGEYRELFPGFHLTIDETLEDGNVVGAKITGEGTRSYQRFGLFPRDREERHEFYLLHHFTECPSGTLTAVESVPAVSRLCDPESSMSWFEKSLASLTSQPVFRHAILVIVLVASLVFALRYFSAYGQRVATGWLEPDNRYWLRVPGLGEISNQHYNATDASGQYVTFVSNSDSLVPNDDNNALDVFVHDRDLGETRLISMRQTLFGASLSFVNRLDSEQLPTKLRDQFADEDYELVQEASVQVDDAGSKWTIVSGDDQYKIRHEENRLAVYNDTCDGPSADGWSIHPYMSADGRYVVFRSSASDLLSGEDSQSTSTEDGETETAPSVIGQLYIHDMTTCDTARLQDYLASRVAERAQDGNVAIEFEQPDAVLPELWWLGASHFERTRLLQQHERVRELARRHLDIVVYYYVQTFAAISLATVSAIGAAVALLFITRKGWSGSDSYVITIFVLLSASTILFSLMPNVFSYSRNIEANKAWYVSYAALENQMWSYITTGHLTNVAGTENERLSPKEFILHVDSHLVNMTNLPLELNPEAIPDIGSLLQELTNPQSFIKPAEGDTPSGNEGSGE